MTQLLTSEELSKISGGIIYHLIPDPNDKSFMGNHMNPTTGRFELDHYMAPELIEYFEDFQRPFHVLTDAEPYEIMAKCETLEEAEEFATTIGCSINVIEFTP